MGGVTREEIAQAKKVDLLSYLMQNEPENLQRDGRHDYRHKAFHTLVISDNGKWNWTDHEKGGKTALDYLVEVLGHDFVSSVRALNEMQGLPTFSFQPVDRRKPVPFSLPAADSNMDAVNRYLQNRGVHPSVIHRCQTEGILYQMTYCGHANCVFVGRDSAGRPQAASLRGCAGKYRKEVSGSRKCFPFCIAADRPTVMVEVYEAPIDAMSGASLRLMQHTENWNSVHYLSLGGLNFMALDGFLEIHPEVTTIRLCLDNDEPGRKFTERMVEHYGVERLVEDAPPPAGKDYNDSLQAYRSGCVQQTKKRGFDGFAAPPSHKSPLEGPDGGREDKNILDKTKMRP